MECNCPNKNLVFIPLTYPASDLLCSATLLSVADRQLRLKVARKYYDLHQMPKGPPHITLATTPVVRSGSWAGQGVALPIRG